MPTSVPILPKARLEALVDGVFAIAMTILVLELKVPDLATRRDPGELFRRLGDGLPTLLAYFFSFGMLAAFWLWHHRLAAKVSRLDRTLVALSLCFLCLVSFFPFAAALLGRYPMNPASLAIYMPAVMGILLCQVSFFAHARRRGLVDPAVGEAEALGVHRRNLKGGLIFALWASLSLIRVGWVWVLGALGVAGVLALEFRRSRSRGPDSGG
ncbi:MAG: DUF1211 domain-containing protein [Acidobacteria bacterium]|nr:DUF1211 domain-containing protein [Acidobacteriota bacterium]